MKRNKNLIIIRGTSGSGKSSLANFLVNNSSCDAVYYEADMFMENEQGQYEFKPEKLGYCHDKCVVAVESSMQSELPLIIVSNTSTKERDFKIYIELATKYGYKVTSLVVENRHGNKDSHNVPEETLKRQEEAIRQSLKLR
jgi:predicted kinase